MHPDDFKQAWQTQTSQTRLTINAELLLQEVRRNQLSFTAAVYWRDVREVGLGVLMVPVWIYLGITKSLPWTWYLAVPAIVWIVGFLLVDRIRHKRQPPEPGEPLSVRVQSSLAQVEHQIWLLRNLFWWYMLPCVLAFLAFLGQVAWQTLPADWSAVLAMAGRVTGVIIICAGIYWVNQRCVRLQLEPRRQELKALLESLTDATPAVS